MGRQHNSRVVGGEKPNKNTTSQPTPELDKKMGVFAELRRKPLVDWRLDGELCRAMSSRTRCVEGCGRRRGEGEPGCASASDPGLADRASRGGRGRRGPGPRK